MIVIVYELQNTSTGLTPPPTSPANPTTVAPPPPTTTPPTQDIPQAGAVLPNRPLTAAERADWIAEYERVGHTPFELEVIRIINEIRSEYSLNPLPIHDTLMMAARFYSQTMYNLNTGLGHYNGPYGGSRGTLSAFGFEGAAAMNGSGMGSPEGVVYVWMHSEIHRNNVLSPNATRIGIGAYGAYVYAIFEWWGE